jgi:dehydrogenase/reductase SDR family protein 4
MLKRFEGKIVLVTASATGIGFGISKRMAEEGATVIISSRNQKNVDQAVAELKKQGLKADGFVCHVGIKEQRDKLHNYIKATFGRLDVLVLNAAVSTQYGSLFDTTEQQFDKTFDINVKAIFFMVKEYHGLMPPGSSILLISSYVGYQLDNTIGIYSLSKTTVLGLTKLLARELRDAQVRVNGIAPGLIRTKFAGALLEHEEIAKQKLEIDRIGEPEDIAATAAYLCSKDGSYVNGETLMVTGFISQKL